MNTFSTVKKPDYLIVLCVSLLILFGLVMLVSASADLGKTKFDDSYFYVKHQIIYGLIPGIIGFFTALKIYYGAYEKRALFILGFTIVLLLLVFTPLGFKAGGAERWLQFGSITFQPSELLKLSFVIYFAAWLSGNEERQKSLRHGLIPFIVLISIIGLILFKQPSTSTFAILAVTSGIIYLVSGAKISHILLGIVFAGILILGISYLSPYRWARITTFFNPGTNLETSGYHINQALTAIGSGGLTGVGFGQSTTKIKYLPEPIGDSIFAIIAEELGFIGSALVIILITLLTIRILSLSKSVPDKFGRLLLVGFGSIIAVQSFMNIASISGVIPLTGVPLPFISYGGTTLAVFMTMSGIIVNISKYAR